MADDRTTRIGRDVNITGGDFVAGDKHVYQTGPIPEELTPEELAAIESRYRTQVAERYNRLGFAGLGIGDTRLSDVALDDVFVRLTLTVEKTVREPIPPEEWEREESSRNPFRRGEKKEDERPRERTVITHEPIALGDALTQHALIVGEPGAGKSTLLRWLAVTFAAGRQREADRLGPQADADRLPLLVELGRLPEAYLQANSRETPNWKVFLPEYLTKQPTFDNIPAALLEQALAAGRCLLLCDGLDEIADLSARRRLADSLAEYTRSSHNRLVLSSRPAGVSGSEGALGARFQRLTIQRFTPEDVRRFFGFLYAQDLELTRSEQASETDALFRAVEGAPKTLELATTPLLATLLFLVWRREGDLPERRVELYELCCRMLIESWEAHHDVAYTGVLADIGWERHLRLLAPLAYAIHNGGQRTDAPAGELIPVLAQAMQAEGLAPPASATLEAEKFLRTLSLRSGLLQFLGGNRYGFPHLTFQEYLAARHIAAQPDPDYIDLVMVDLHKAWWREVHLLVIGHLGSGSEGAEKVSRLLHLILNLYHPPSRLLRSQRLDPWVPDWLNYLVKTYENHPILQWPVYTLALAIVLPPALPALLMKFQATHVQWQLERRLAWMLRREFLFATASFFDCSVLGVTAQLRISLSDQAKRLLIQAVFDPGRLEKGDTGLHAVSARNLVRLGEVSEDVVRGLVEALDDSASDVRCAAADNLGELGEASEIVVAGLVAMLGDPEFDVQQAAADSLAKLGNVSDEVSVALAATLDYSDTSGLSNTFLRGRAADCLGELGQTDPNVLDGLLKALGDSEWYVRDAAARALGKLKHASPEIISALLRALGDPDEVVVSSVASSLRLLEQPSPEARDSLVQSYGDSNALLGSLGDNEWSVTKEAIGSLISLGHVFPSLTETLMINLRTSEGQTREGIAICLAWLGQTSIDVMETLVRTLDVANGHMREQAAQSLGEFERPAPKVLQALAAALGDSDPEVRKAAASSLGKLGQASPRIINALTVTLEDPVDAVQEAAFISLMQLGRVSDVDMVDALGSAGWPMNWAAAKSLARLRQVSNDALTALIEMLGHWDWEVRDAASSILVDLEGISNDIKPKLVAELSNSDENVRAGAARSLGKFDLQEESELCGVLIALNRRLHDRNDDVRRAALTSIRRLLDGRQIPGYRWVPIRERRERARKRRILGYWVVGISLGLLVAWVAAGVATYWQVDPFIERFVTYALALVALAAGGVQVLGWLRRPPWDR